MPIENLPFASLRYQLLAGLSSCSRAQKKVCGGGKAAIDPAPLLPTTSLLLANSGTMFSLTGPVRL